MHCVTSAYDAELAHLVERHLAKVEVASSSLVFRSMLCESCCPFFRGQLFLFDVANFFYMSLGFIFS